MNHTVIKNTNLFKWNNCITLTIHTYFVSEIQVSLKKFEIGILQYLHKVLVCPSFVGRQRRHLVRLFVGCRDWFSTALSVPRNVFMFRCICTGKVLICALVIKCCFINFQLSSWRNTLRTDSDLVFASETRNIWEFIRVTVITYYYVIIIYLYMIL